MPDGARVNFPDDMPSDEIRSLIEKKFPAEAAQARTGAAPEGQRPRIIEFEGRRISVPHDATDDEIRKILNTPPPAALPPLPPGYTLDKPWEKDPIVQPAQSSDDPWEQFPRALPPDDPWEQFPRALPPLPPGYTLDQPAASRPATFEERFNPSKGDRLPFAPGVPPQATPPAQDESILDRAPRNLQLGMQDVSRGAANIAGAPFDITNAFGNLLLTGADQVAQIFGGNVDYRLPVGASDTIADAGSNVADLFGIESIPWEDRSRQERRAGNMIDFGTQALAGGAGLARAAAKRAPQIVEGTKKTVADAFTRPYLENASRTVVGDTASGLGSGFAVDFVDEHYPDSPVAHGLAAFLGGLGGSSATELAQAGGRFLSDVTRPITFRTYDPQIPIDPATNLPARRTDVETAARMMQELTRDPLTRQSRAPAAAQSIGERAEEFRAAGLPIPTSGIISDNVGLYSAESAARAREGVPFIERDTRLRSAASDRVGGLRDPDADQGAVTERARQVRDERMAPAESAVAAARASDDAATAARQAEGAPLNLARGSDTRVDASRNLDRAVVEDTYLPDRAHKNELYRAIDPEGVEMRDATPLAQAVGRIRQAEAALPPSMQTRSQILTDLERLVDPQTGEAQQIAFRDLETMRMKLSQAARSARGGENPDFDLADAYDAVRREIGREGQRMAGEGGAAGERAARARSNYVESYAPKYRAGPGDEMTGFTRKIDQDPTRSTTPPSETARRFLTAPEKAASLQRVLADSPSQEAGLASVRDYLRSDFAASVLNPEGTVSSHRAHLWRSNNAAVLEHFPSLKGEFDEMVSSARQGAAVSDRARADLDASLARAKMTEVDIERSAIGTLLRGEDPRDVARGIFKPGTNYGAAKRLDEINKMIGGDAQAKRGWKAAVAEVVSDLVTHVTKLDEGRATPGEGFRVDLGKLESVFDKHAADLAKVFSPAEMNRLRQAHALLEPLRNAVMRATGGSNTIDKYEQIWRLAEAGLKAKYGVLKGGGLLRTLRIAASTLPDNSASVQRLIQRAFFDPDIAQYLLTRKVRNLDYKASNKWIRRALAGAEYARESATDTTEPKDEIQ